MQFIFVPNSKRPMDTMKFFQYSLLLFIYLILLLLSFFLPSLRTLCRALIEAGRGYHGSILRSLYEVSWFFVFCAPNYLLIYDDNVESFLV